MRINLERRQLPAVLRPELRHELNALRGNWSWFVLLGVALIVLGTVALGSVVIDRFAAWGWSLAGGIIDVILGVLIWQGWPASSLRVIGLFVGIDLIFRGFNWIALGLALRSPPRPGTA
jgi:uncharacterized membrane protein HdeD (DUF308 family)